VLWGWVNLGTINNYLDVSPPWFQAFFSVIFSALPGMTVALAVVLVISGMKQLPTGQVEPPDSDRPNWFQAASRFSLAGLLLAALSFSIFWSSIWDQTSDGLTGIWFTTQACLVAIGAGVLMTYILKNRQGLSAAFFLIGVPIILILTFTMGWRISNLEITAERAARVQRAVERYYAREQGYPATLDELTPWDLLWIPGPVILQGEGWCYQGGGDSYRLGSFYRDFFSSPLAVKIYAQAGTPPETSWDCDKRLAEMKARYDIPLR
jgi:hypothetical protein